MMNASFRAELEAPSCYKVDLERSGFQVRQWHVDAAVDLDRAAGFPRYASWSDGEVGIFVLDAGPSAVTAVDAQVISDFVAIEIPFEEADLSKLDMETDQIKSVPVSVRSHDIQIQYFHAGSRVRLRAAPEGFKAVTLMVKARTLRNWGYLALPSTLISVLEDQPACIPLPVQIERERDSIIAMPADLPHKPLFYRMKSSTIFWLLLSHLRDQDACGDKAVSPRAQRRLALVRRLIDEAPERRLSVDELARQAGLNRTTLRAQFKQVYGMTVSEYRTAELMQRAERMLRDDQLSVVETAHALGYSAASSFSAAYMRHFNHRPGHGRKGQLLI